MSIPEISRIIHDWCKTKTFVNRAWIFGSRTQDIHRPDSDIDVAVEALPVENPFAEGEDHYTAASKKDTWKRELELLLPYPVHFCPVSYHEESESAEDVRRNGILVFDLHREKNMELPSRTH